MQGRHGVGGSLCRRRDGRAEGSQDRMRAFGLKIDVHEIYETGNTLCERLRSGDLERPMHYDITNVTRTRWNYRTLEEGGRRIFLNGLTFSIGVGGTIFTLEDLG
jgi:hypothetical protein